MKKILIIILSIAIVVLSFLSGYLFGLIKKNPYDANNDGNVDSQDLYVIQKYLLNN